MAKKSSLDSKLGSWTDQASLTQTDTNQVDENHAATNKGEEENSANREEYHVPQTLIQRIFDASEQSNLSSNEVVGQLLTWALDQVDAGNHTIRKHS